MPRGARSVFLSLSLPVCLAAATCGRDTRRPLMRASISAGAHQAPCRDKKYRAPACAHTRGEGLLCCWHRWPLPAIAPLSNRATRPCCARLPAGCLSQVPTRDKPGRLVRCEISVDVSCPSGERRRQISASVAHDEATVREGGGCILGRRRTWATTEPRALGPCIRKSIILPAAVPR
jgi:hypothetical protein